MYIKKIRIHGPRGYEEEREFINLDKYVNIFYVEASGPGSVLSCALDCLLADRWMSFHRSHSTKLLYNENVFRGYVEITFDSDVPNVPRDMVVRRNLRDVEPKYLVNGKPTEDAEVIELLRREGIMPSIRQCCWSGRQVDRMVRLGFDVLDLILKTANLPPIDDEKAHETLPEWKIMEAFELVAHYFDIIFHFLEPSTEIRMILTLGPKRFITVRAAFLGVMKPLDEFTANQKRMTVVALVFALVMAFPHPVMVFDEIGHMFSPFRLRRIQSAIREVGKYSQIFLINGKKRLFADAFRV